MNPLVPDFILEQDAEGQYAGAVDAAVLHVSLPAIVELAEQMIARQAIDPDTLRSLFDPLFEAVHQSGGFVATLSPGGGFTALFPDRPGRNVTRHARSAALAMRRSLLELAARRALGAGGAQTPFRIGLAWGTVHWTIVRIAADRAYFLLYGPAVEACQATDRGVDDSELHLDRSFRERLPAASARENVAELDDADLLSGPPSLTIASAPTDADAEAFLPPGAGDLAPEGEIREVTTVSVSLARVESPTELLQQLHEIAAMYGATFAGMTVTERGFGAQFYFGAPVAHESDHDRALDFALELKSNGLGVPRLAVGITRARCLVGFFGAVGRREFACVGRAVHLAAQIARKAAPSSIWADERAFLAGEASHQWSTENIFRFEGFDLPILVYSLERRRIAVQEEFYDLGPIGREAELGRLTQALEPLFTGRSAGVVYILGEAGIGKSYLVHSYRHQRAQLMDMRPLLWIEARCDQTLRTPLYAFEFALKEYLGISSELGQRAKEAGLDLALELLLERLPESWTEVRAGIDRSRQALARLLRLHGEEPAAAGDARRDDVLGALAALLVAESSLQPVVVHLDDAQWADPTSLDAVRAITAACKDLPLAVICSARPEGSAGEGVDVRIPLDAGIPSQTIELAPLPPERLISLAEPFFGGPLPTMLESLLGQTAGGNPFFAQEILAYWLEDGRYGSSHDAVRSSRFMPPRTVNSLLVARLERLEPPTRQTVISAAVLGREFDTRVLARMIPDASALVDHLRFGEAQRIWSRMGEHRFEFCTVLIRDAAYGMQPKETAERQHRLAAEAIEAVYGDDLEDQRAALDSHRRLAG
ncbi:AAA family ATPase [Sorangium sp. So ce375]|uniref:AAA family ATPase n=1 Tax=Sorangium sp. So ce375 TaxID=3133306 RepID=UPI003F5ADF63